MKLQFLALSLFLIPSLQLSAAEPEKDSIAAAANRVMAENEASTLTFQVTRRNKDGDFSFEALGMLLNSKGLAVTSIASVETPSVETMDSIIALAMQDDAEEDTGDLSQITWIRPNGTEVEAELVLTDPATDLAFIQIKDASDLPAVPEAATSAPGLLDDIFAISSAPPEHGRAPRLEYRQIASLLSTPRELYAISSEVVAGLPFYNLEGEFIGLSVSLHDRVVILPADIVTQKAKALVEAP